MDNPSFNQNGIEYNGEQIAYKDSTYELVSKVAYLIGVPLRIFQNEHEPPKIEIYNRLEQPAMDLSRDKNAEKDELVAVGNGRGNAGSRSVSRRIWV